MINPDQVDYKRFFESLVGRIDNIVTKMASSPAEDGEAVLRLAKEMIEQVIALNDDNQKFLKDLQIPSAIHDIQIRFGGRQE